MLVRFGIDLAPSLVRGDRCASEQRTHYGRNGGLNAPRSPEDASCACPRSW